MSIFRVDLLEDLSRSERVRLEVAISSVEHSVHQTHRGGDDAVFDLLSELNITAIAWLRKLLHGNDEEETEEPQEAVADESGRPADAVDLGQFVSAVLKALSLAGESGSSSGSTASLIDKVVALFDRVDVHSAGWVTWEHVAEYILRPKVYQRTYKSNRESVTFMEQPVPVDARGDNVERVVFIKELNKIVSCGVDGSTVIRNSSTCAVEKVVSDHTSMVCDATFAPRHNLLLTSSTDRTILSYDAISLSRQKMARASSPQICLAWDSANDRAVSGGADGGVTFWTFTEQVRPAIHHHFAAHEDMVMGVLSRGDTLFTGSLDALVKVWDLTTSQNICTQRGHAHGVHALAYLEDPTTAVISGGADRQLIIWAPTIPTPVGRLSAHEQQITAIAAVEGTSQLISGDAGGVLRVWDLRMMECLQTLRPRGWLGFGYSDPFHTFTFNTQAREIVTVGRKWLVWKPVVEYDVNVSVSEITYNASTNHVVALVGKDVLSWDGISGKLRGRYTTLSDAYSDVMGICFDDRERLLVVGFSDGTITLYTYPHGTKACTFLVMPDGSEVSAVFSVGDRMILAASRYGRLAIYSIRDVTAPEELRSWSLAPVSHGLMEAPVMAYGRFCGLFACGGANEIVQIWGIENGLLLHTIHTDHDISDCVFADDLNVFITVDYSGWMCVYSIPQFHPIARILCETAPAMVAYHAPTHTLVTDGARHLVVAWDLGKILGEFKSRMAADAVVPEEAEEETEEAAEEEESDGRVTPTPHSELGLDPGSIPRRQAKKACVISDDCAPFVSANWEGCNGEPEMETLRFVFAFDSGCPTVVAVGTKQGAVHFWGARGESYGAVSTAGRRDFKSPLESDELERMRHAHAQRELEIAAAAAKKAQEQTHYAMPRSTPSPVATRSMFSNGVAISEQAVRRHGHPQRAQILGNDLSLAQLSTMVSPVANSVNATDVLIAPTDTPKRPESRSTSTRPVTAAADGHSHFHEWFLRQEFGEGDEE